MLIKYLITILVSYFYVTMYLKIKKIKTAMIVFFLLLCLQVRNSGMVWLGVLAQISHKVTTPRVLDSHHLEACLGQNCFQNGSLCNWQVV